MAKKSFSEEAAKERLNKDREKITEDDVNKVNEKAAEIKKKFEDGGPLERFIKDAKLMLSIVKDYWAGEYREIPWFSMASIVAALLYVLNPIDLVPDFIPFFGQLDDAAVVAACIYMVEKDLKKYEEWKSAQNKAA